MTDFERASEVERLAEKLITEHHKHLERANIVYLFRTGSWLSNGQIVYGRAARVTGQYEYLLNADFIITINKDEWDKGDAKLREALLDHELSHCVLGVSGWGIRQHDVQDFTDVIKRRGLWTEGLQLFHKAAQEYEQQTLFKGEPQLAAVGK